MSDEKFTPKWQGYIVLGSTDPAQLQADLDSCFAGGELAGLVVEPARVFSVAGGVSKRVEVWNKNRTKVQADSLCQQPPLGRTENYIQNYEGVPEVLRIAGGFQVGVRHNGRQSVIVRAAPGGGELGAPTEEIPLYDGESVLVGADFMDGGSQCSNVLRTINGVGGASIQIGSDSGVRIGNHPELNRIVIAVNGEGLNFCPDVAEPEEVECLPAAEENCGPAEGVVVGCPGTPDSKAGFDEGPPPGNDGGDSGDQIPPAINNQQSSYMQLYGSCQYLRNEAGWLLNANNANFNAHCVSPTANGYLGQLRTIVAAPDDIELPGYVRNPLFNNGDDHWIVPGGSTLVSAEDSTKFGELPYLEFTGTTSQPLISVPASRYRIQFRFETSAALNYRILSPRYGTTLYQGVVQPQIGTQILSEFFDTVKDDLTIEFTTAGTACITEIGLVPWQML